MDIHRLQWDSDFFGMLIGQADIQTMAEAEELKSRHEELKQQFDLLYVFDTNGVGVEVEGARLIDEKILYCKSCEPRIQYEDISLYKEETPTDDLYLLALVSGSCSRFKLDERLPKGSFERLYRRWIENSCPQKGTNKQILLFSDEKKIARGMITVDYHDEVGHIGLVAVDMKAQHQGVGGKIMSTLDGYLYKCGIKTIEVLTQKANVNACRYYEKNGFVAQSVTPVYHWWL